MNIEMQAFCFFLFVCLLSEFCCSTPLAGDTMMNRAMTELGRLCPVIICFYFIFPILLSLGRQRRYNLHSGVYGLLGGCLFVTLYFWIS